MWDAKTERFKKNKYILPLRRKFQGSKFKICIQWTHSTIGTGGGRLVVAADDDVVLPPPPQGSRSVPMATIGAPPNNQGSAVVAGITTLS